MSVPIEVALPCRLLTLKVRVGPEEGVTTLEDLVARAILAGKDTIHSQATLFALPERIVVDVVHSLWMKGHVVVDFDEGRLGLSDGTREMLSGTESLADSAAELQTRKFLFEPVTGMFFDRRDGKSRPREGSLELPLRQGIDESNLPQAELVRAVQAAIRRDRRNGFRANVLDVSFGSPVLRGPTQLRWLHVHVEARQDQDSNRISVVIAEQRYWEEQARRRLSAHIAELADREPDHRFVQRLRGRATLSLAPPERVERLLQQLEEKLDGLGEMPLSEVKGRQEELARLARRIQRRLAAVNYTRAAATVVNRVAGHWWAVEDLVRSAERQILLVAPMIDYRPLNQLLPALRDRLDHGVQLVVLWGRNNADSLPDRVATALYELARRYRTRVMLGERSAASEACLVVQDDRRALVGSHSPLATEKPDDRHEVSVLIERAEHGPNPPQAVTELLFWAREAFPNWMTGQRIMVHQGDFAETDTEGSEPRAAEQPLPSIDPQAMDADIVRLWAETWADYHAALLHAKARAEEVGPTVEVVRDGEHRDGVWEGLRTATRRLVVTDDRIDPVVADERLAKAIRARADAGAKVWLAHPSLPRASNGQESFAALAGDAGKSVQVRLRRSGGRLVVADDSVLVGSYSPLGTDEPRARYAGTRRHQLGLRVQGEQFATEVMARLGVNTGARSDVGRSTPTGSAAAHRARSRAGGTAALGLLLEARGARGGADFGPWVAARLRDLDDPSDVLDTWLRTGVPARELRPAVASLLQQGGPPHRVQREAWVAWLVEDAWQRRSFVEAALIARLLHDRSGALASASTATVAIELGPVGFAVSDAALKLNEHPVGPQMAAGAGALAELLLWSGGEGAEALSLLSLPTTWQGFADEAIALPKTVSGPVPLEVLSANFARSVDYASLEGRRTALIAEIDKIERLRQRFDFPTGKALHDGLFAPDGLLTTIRTAAAAGLADAARLQSVLPANIQRHLDEVIARAGEEPMAWYRQGAYLRQIEEIVRSARTLAVAGSTGDATLSLHGYESIAVRVANTWDLLFSEATAIPYPYELPVVALLDKLSPLAWWARERT